MCSVQCFGWFYLFKQIIHKSFLLVVVPPNICGYLPKYVNVYIQVFETFFNFVDNLVGFTWIKVIIANHNQNEVFENPNFVFFLDACQRVEEFLFIIESTFKRSDTPLENNFFWYFVNGNGDFIVKLLPQNLKHLKSSVKATICKFSYVKLDFENRIVEQVKSQKLVFVNLFVS